MPLRFLAFWAINDRLDEAELFRQLGEMKQSGFDGVVWQPRFYPNEPEYLGPDYLAILSRVILHAKSLDLLFWIYDENGWPSGTVGGEMLKRFPHLRQQWIELVEEQPDDCLATFSRDGKTWHIGRRYGHGVDYLNPALAPAFLKLTYERYRDGLDLAAFAHVSTFFCDEPEFGIGHAYDEVSPHGALPWGDHVAERGIPDFEDLFFVGETRRNFIESLTDLFNDGFTAPINRWCKAHGKDFTAHVKGEEHPLFQVAMVGSCHPFFRNLTLPGIDALERFPSGGYFPRQVASVAAQFGSGRCMVECFGGAGWGATPEDLENYLKWLAGHGLTDFVTHLWQYRFKSQAMRDWPVSFPNHVTWGAAFPEILRRVRDFAAALDRSHDTLLVSPHRAIMREYVPAEIKHANIHNGADWPDSPAARMSNAFIDLCDRAQAAGMKWHVTGERDLESFGKVIDGVLHLGKAKYARVIPGDGVDLAEETRQMIRTLLASAPEFTIQRALPADPLPPGLPVNWRLVSAPENQLVLEARPLGDGLYEATYQSEAGILVRPEFLDDVSEVEFQVRTTAGSNVIRFRADDPSPWLAVRGDFRVLSDSPWTDGPHGVRATEGPFRIVADASFDAADLLASGFPFVQAPVVLEAELINGRDRFPKRSCEWTANENDNDKLGNPSMVVHSLSILADRPEVGPCQGSFPRPPSADAAKISIDGTDAVWTWGPDWKITPPAGARTLQVELVPSGFNSYGPHHHVDGDRPIVSPVQYAYRKNFADRPDAPENTRVTAWHFKPFGIHGL